MLKPKIAILVEGGVVQAVVTSENSFEYRLIDLDDKKYEDYEADATKQDIEQYTREAMG